MSCVHLLVSTYSAHRAVAVPVFLFVPQPRCDVPTERLLDAVKLPLAQLLLSLSSVDVMMPLAHVLGTVSKKLNFKCRCRLIPT